MSKLTPPALQNLKRREDFYKQHSELPESKYELERIQAIRQYKNSKKLKSKYSKNFPEKPLDGLEYYKKVKEQEAKDRKFFNPINRLLKMFNRVK
jgi:hypothetical protein